MYIHLNGQKLSTYLLSQATPCASASVSGLGAPSKKENSPLSAKGLNKAFPDTNEKADQVLNPDAKSMLRVCFSAILGRHPMTQMMWASHDEGRIWIICLSCCAHWLSKLTESQVQSRIHGSLGP